MALWTEAVAEVEPGVAERTKLTVGLAALGAVGDGHAGFTAINQEEVPGALSAVSAVVEVVAAEVKGTSGAVEDGEGITSQTN